MTEEILVKMQKYTGLNFELSKNKPESNVVLIGDLQFVTSYQPAVTQGNHGLVLQQLNDMAKTANLPALLLAEYIPKDIAEQFVRERANYIDAAGNCFVRHGNLCVVVEGKKPEFIPKSNTARAFQEAGIKLIFQLLLNPRNINLPYRELAKKADISLGSVSAIVTELMNSGFILQSKNKKVLKEKPGLLNRWLTAYNDAFRPRLLKKRMRFSGQPDLSAIETGALWGGEPGAAILTGYLIPEKFTIYTGLNWQDLKTMKLIPDENGNVEILRQFWQQPNDGKTAPPVLIYADLMNSGFGRNIETAKIILENELSYIK